MPRIQDYPAIASVDGNEIIPCVDTPEGTPTTKGITVSQIRGALLALSASSLSLGASSPASGLVCVPYATNRDVIVAKGSDGNDYRVLRQTAADTWQLGFEDWWTLDIYSWTLGLWGKNGGVVIFEPAGGASLRVNNVGIVGAKKPAGTLATRATIGHRLTLTSGVPVTTADVTGASTIYLTPDGGDQISIWDGTQWVEYELAEISLALSGLTSGKNYDVFVHADGGTPALELSAAWTTNTGRADALDKHEGVDVKGSDPTRLFVGTIRTTSTTTTEDSEARRFVWNRYNRRRRSLVKKIAGTWSQPAPSGAWRRANNAASSIFEYVQGLNEEPIEVSVLSFAAPNAASVSSVSTGVGVDSATANSAQKHGGFFSGSTTVATPAEAHYLGNPGIGYHEISWLETSNAAVQVNWTGAGGVVESGMLGTLFA